MSNKRYIVDDKDAQSDNIHERSKNRNDFANNLNNEREIATERQSDQSTQNDEDVKFPRAKKLEAVRNWIIEKSRPTGIQEYFAPS